MAWRQGHARDVGDIPCADDDAARVRRGFELLDDLRELIDVATLTIRP